MKPRAKPSKDTSPAANFRADARYARAMGVKPPKHTDWAVSVSGLVVGIGAKDSNSGYKV